MIVTGVGAIAPSAHEDVRADGRVLKMMRAATPATIASREARRLTRPSLLALAACKEALGDAATEGLGIALGSGFGACEATRLALEGLFERADLISPSHFVASVRHEAASSIARVLSLRGPAVATSARRLSFEQALGWALRQIGRARARGMLVAGTDEVTPLLARSLARARLRHEPIAFGEGAGALLLEGEETSRPALARIEGFLEGAGTIDDMLQAVRRRFGGRFDLILTDEEGSDRRRADALRVGEELACPTRATDSGYVASGGSLVAVAAVRAPEKRVLCYAREVDGTFAAYSVTKP